MVKEILLVKMFILMLDPTASKQLGRGRSGFKTSTQTSEWFQFVYRQK